MKKLTPAQGAWLDQYSKVEAVPETTVDWIRQVAINAKLRKMVTKFPPSCVVRAKQKLGCPRPGRLGIVVNMATSGHLKVIEADVPGASPNQFAGMCDPEWLEVVGYWRGLTPDGVKTILGSFEN